MSLGITNINALLLTRILGNTEAAQSRVTTQLSTGLRINTGKDDPSGIIAANSLKMEITSVERASLNAQRADSILSVADGALGEVNTLLNEIEGLVIDASNDTALTASEQSAIQSQIDAAIESISNIIDTTDFNGTRLLDGTLAIRTSNVDSNDISDLSIFSRSPRSNDTTMQVQVVASAMLASAGISNGALAGTDTLDGDLQIEITGSRGTSTLSIGSGTAISDLVSMINAETAQTGAVASLDGTNLNIKSSAYGDDEFVTISVLSGGNTSAGTDITGATRTTGTDASVLVNGQNTKVDGLDVEFSVNGFSGTFSLQSSFNTHGTTSFTISANGGGATFLLGSDAGKTSTIGIDSLSTSRLGGGTSGGFLDDLRSGGSADMTNDTATALNIVQKAIGDISTARGRIGGFQKYTVKTSKDAMDSIAISLDSSRSAIEDTDYATATAELNKQTILMQSGISLLGMATQQTSQILTLLSGI